jgi:hypothetical protein
MWRMSPILPETELDHKSIRRGAICAYAPARSTVNHRILPLFSAEPEVRGQIEQLLASSAAPGAAAAPTAPAHMVQLLPPNARQNSAAAFRFPKLNSNSDISKDVVVTEAQVNVVPRQL